MCGIVVIPDKYRNITPYIAGKYSGIKKKTHYLADKYYIIIRRVVTGITTIPDILYCIIHIGIPLHVTTFV
jgi:hypothetical protein